MSESDTAQPPKRDREYTHPPPSPSQPKGPGPLVYPKAALMRPFPASPPPPPPSIRRVAFSTRTVWWSLFSVENLAALPHGELSGAARPLGVRHVSTSSPQTATIVSCHPLTLGLPSASPNWLQTLVGARGVLLGPLSTTPPTKRFWFHSGGTGPRGPSLQVHSQI